MLEIYRFSSKEKGEDVLFLGSVHGNEVCGSLAIDEVLRKIKEGLLTIQKGSVAFIPRVNKRAYDEGKRFIDVNLNRVVKKKDSANTHEERLAQALIPFLEEADYVVDLHSMTAKTEPMVFLDYESVENNSLAEATGAPFCVKGWPAVFKSDELCSDTISCVHRSSGHGVTVECGQHNEASSVEVARNVILKVLKRYNGLRGDFLTQATKSASVSVRIKKVFFRDSDKDTFTHSFTNFEAIKRGELIASRSGGITISAEEDGYILLPNNNAQVGHEWFYFGVKE